MTHMLELWSSMTRDNKDVKRLECHYESDGLKAEIEDTFDGQKYIVLIEPKREKPC